LLDVYIKFSSHYFDVRYQQWHILDERDALVKSLAKELLKDRNFGVFDYKTREVVTSALKSKTDLEHDLYVCLNEISNNPNRPDVEIRNLVKEEYLKKLLKSLEK